MSARPWGRGVAPQAWQVAEGRAEAEFRSRQLDQDIDQTLDANESLVADVRVQREKVELLEQLLDERAQLLRDATEWTFTLEPTDDGCRITQSFEIISLPRATEWVISKVLPEHIDRSQALREDLERLGAVAAAVPAVQFPSG